MRIFPLKFEIINLFIVFQMHIVNRKINFNYTEQNYNLKKKFYI